MLPAPDPVTRHTEPVEAGALDVALASNDLRTLFQPIVWMADDSLAGVEALTRGPADTDLELPARLFAAANAADRTVELDLACARQALRSAQSRGVAGTVPLFVNVSPGCVRPAFVRELVAMRDALAPRARLMLDIASSAVVDDALHVLATAHEARKHGIGVALDDIDARPAALALLPLLRPDVLKLDRLRLRQAHRSDIAAVASTVHGYAEATGAIVVVEGVETAAHRAWATTMGATAVQGWLTGRPRELVDLSCEVAPVALMRHPTVDPHETPFSLVEHQGDVRVGHQAELLAMSRNLEFVAARWHADGALVLACVQDELRFTPATAAVYADLATRSALVAVLGAGMPTTPAPGVRGLAIAGDDRLRDEWNVVVLGPHYAAALLARDLGDDRTRGSARRYSFLMTHRRDVVVAATRALMTRVSDLR